MLDRLDTNCIEWARNEAAGLHLFWSPQVFSPKQTDLTKIWHSRSTLKFCRQYCQQRVLLPFLCRANITLKILYSIFPPSKWNNCKPTFLGTGKRITRTLSGLMNFNIKNRVYSTQSNYSFTRFLKWPPIISANFTKRVDFTVETQCVLCEVSPEF